MNRFAIVRFLFLAPVLTLLINNADAQSSEYEIALKRCRENNQIRVANTGCMNGIMAPDFSARMLDGKFFSIKQVKGKVVVLNFWFVACSPCRAEMPSLNKIVSSFKNDDVIFVSIALDKEADLKQFLSMNRFLFKTIADPAFIITDKTYHIKNFPTTIVIDKKGIIKLFTMGSKDSTTAIDISLDENLVRTIDGCLGKKYQKKMIFDNPPGLFKL